MNHITIHFQPPTDDHAWMQEQLNNEGLSEVKFKSTERKEEWEENPETVWVFVLPEDKKDAVLEQLRAFLKKEWTDGSCHVLETDELIDLP